MNALSVIAGILLFFAASLIGLWLKKRKTNKAKFYEDYYAYLVYALEKISYERMPVKEIKGTFSMKERSDFCDFLMEKRTSTPLSEGELSEIKEYLAGIGMTDADTQIQSLTAKCSELKRFTESACEKMRKDGKLYFKLSVLMGIALFIVIV